MTRRARRTDRIFQHAYASISAALDRGEFEGGKYLPSVASLARMCDVSSFTMWKVIDALRHEGRLASIRGHRIVLPGPAHEIRTSGPGRTLTHAIPATKSSALQQRIEKEILNGRLKHDQPLPSTKELTATYGVCRLTLRKALSALTDASVLIHRGARFYPVPIGAAASRPKSRIVLLGPGGTLGQNITWGYWHQEYFKLLELECANAGIALEVVCYERDRSGLRLMDGQTKAPVKLATTPNLVGYLLEVTGPDSVDDELLRTIASSGRPVAVLDELGTWPRADFVRRHPNIRVFRNTVADQPSRQVARFLLELGHRTAVFISPFHGSEYSMRRYAGLAQIFSAAEGARIVPVTSHYPGENLASQGTTSAALDKMLSFSAEWMKEFSFAYQHPLETIFELLKSAVGDGRIRESLNPLFERALATKEATAWIMVNDESATYAFDVLALKRIPVPGRISIISFDDLPVALTNSISSYNFNGRSMIIAMLRYVTNPRLYPQRNPIIEIEGKIIARQTTGRANSPDASSRK